MYNCSEGSDCYHTAYDLNGYGGMAYYTSVDCGYGQDSNHTDTGCTTDYAQSEVKYVVDAWKAAKAPAATEARLLTLDDMMDDLGIEMNRTNPTSYQIVQTEDTPQWVFGENYYYWTMTPNTDKDIDVWYVDIRSSGYVLSNNVPHRNYAVRPVITISKSLVSNAEN